MYNIYVRCNFKRTLIFENKVWNKYMKKMLSTKTKNLIKACTNLKQVLKKKHKLSRVEI